MEEKTDNVTPEQMTNKGTIGGVFEVTHTVLSSICLLFLTWNIWPGSLSVVIVIIVLTAILWIPGLLFFVIYDIFKIFKRFRKNKREAKLLSYRLGLHVLIVSCTFVMLTLDIPLRVAFCISKPNFEQFLEEHQSDIKTSRYDKAITENLGVWTVDHCLKDSRGGIYFRIGTEPLWMIDVLSYGFAENPNCKGTPFGNAEYSLNRIIGDWYFFCASDDW